MKKFFLTTLVFSLGIITLFAQPQKFSRYKRSKCSVNMADLFTKGIDTKASRGVADNYYMWDNGSTILVKFMSGGSQTLRNKVMEAARQWEAVANIKFKFVPDNTPSTNIRIKLGTGLGHNSYVGTFCNLFAQDVQTLNLDTLDFIDYDFYYNEAFSKGINLAAMTDEEWNNFLQGIYSRPNLKWNDASMKGTTMHELGHALGLLHEQSYPGAIKWNKSDSVYNYYYKRCGWDRATVDAQVFEVSNQFYTNGTFYDSKSIMQYSVEPWETLDGFSVPRNNYLSAGDKNIIGLLYPKNSKTSARDVPRVTVTNLNKVEVINNAAKGGLSIFPSFDMKTNAKVGQVYLVATLMDEDNQYVMDNDKKYNWGGAVATYIKANVLPNTKGSYNKLKKNLELFLPYSEIPEMNGKKIKVEFTVVLDDIVNGQFNKLMSYALTRPLSLNR